MKKLKQELPLPIIVLQERVNDINECVNTLSAFLRRKKQNRYGLTKKIARQRIKNARDNRKSLQLAIKILQLIHNG